MSRASSSSAKSGLRYPAAPAMASVKVPPLSAPLVRAPVTSVRAEVAVEMGAGAGWQAAPTRPSRASQQPGARRRPRRLMGEAGRDDDVGHRDGQEAEDQHPGGPVQLALEAAPGAIAAAEVAATAADGAPEAGRLRRLQQHPGHQEPGEDELGDDQEGLDLLHVFRAGRNSTRPARLQAA